VRRELLRVYRAAGFGAITAAMLPAYLARRAIASDEERDRVQDGWVHVWSGALLKLFEVRPQVVGASPTGGSGMLVVANHRSTIDIAVLLNVFGGHMVSREDLSRWPLVGAAARSVGTIFVDRADKASGASAVRTMRSLLDRGRTVNVFPEGTTFADDVVRPFHPGAFLAAMRGRAVVVPVGVAYEKGSQAGFVDESFVAHLARMSSAPPTRVVVRIGEAIPVGGVTRAADLRDRAHAAVQALVHEARAICDGGA
jgi:1-acyl-sn-glycerol-3-phosphate acyltransferase